MKIDLNRQTKSKFRFLEEPLSFTTKIIQEKNFLNVL